MNKNTHGGDIYRNKVQMDFSANCNPFGTPKAVTEAVAKAANSLGNYPDVLCQELRHELAGKLGIDEKMLFFGNGAAEVIYAFAKAINAKITMVLAPTFSEYQEAFLAAGCQITRYELREETEFSVEEDILDELESDIDVLVLCNPNNPTGKLIHRNLMERIIDKCTAKGIFLLVDECFMDFTDNPKENSVMNKAVINDKVMVLQAFTKLYAMAGARLGYGVTCNDGLINKMRQQVQTWNVSSLAQAAGIAALKQSDYVKESLEYIKKEKEYLVQELKLLGLKVYKTDANYILIKGREDIYLKLLQRGILIRDCSNYYGLSSGYYRVAVKLHEENQKLLQEINKVLEEV